MTNKYKAQLVLMDGKSKIQQQVTHPENVQVVTPEWLESYTGNNWQAQRLIITDETGKEIATYPQIPNITYKIDLADVRKWVDSGRSESVELAAYFDRCLEDDGSDNCCVGCSGKGGLDCSAVIEPDLTNNTVKMVCGEEIENKSISALQRAIDKLGDAKMREIADSIPYDPNGMTADEYFARLSGQHPINWNATHDKWINDAALFDIGNKDLAKRIFNWFKNNVK